jgi:hypothetical protein
MIALILIAVVLGAVAATVREAVLDRPRARPQSHRTDPDLLPPGSRLT